MDFTDEVEVTDKVYLAQYGTMITTSVGKQQMAQDTVVKSRIVNQDDRVHSDGVNMVDQNGLQERKNAEVLLFSSNGEINLSQTHVENPGMENDHPAPIPCIRGL